MKIIVSLILSLFFISTTVLAEKVCVNKKAKANRKGVINLQQAFTVSNAACSAKQFELLDTSVLVGPQGPQGPQGEAGPFPDTLPSGKTLKGFYSLGGTATAENHTFYDNISFNYPLAASPIVEVIEIGETASANCPGTSTNPQAAPGYLCVFEGNNGAGLFTTTNRKSNSLIVRNFNIIFEVGTSASTVIGGSIQAGADAAGGMSSRGSWAVRAP